MRVHTVAGAVGGALVGVGLAVWFLRGGPKLPPDAAAVIERAQASDVAHVIAGETGSADSGGVRLWYESIAADGPEKGVVLLNASMGSDSLYWPPRLIRGLARAGYRVVRFDQRGTGASDWLPGWSRKHPYSLLEMAADAIAVLDAQRVAKAHVIGLSLGGFVAQEVAIGYPDRVASLTLMSTAADPTDTSLPGMRIGPMARAGLRGLPLLRYRLLGGEKNLVSARVAAIVGSGGDGWDVDELARIVLYERRYRRGTNLRAIAQHQAAVATTRSRYPSLADVRVPTLVIHGTADSFLPIEHAEKLVELIPAAQHLWLEGVDHHQFPYPGMAAVIEAIVAHVDAVAPAGSRPDPVRQATRPRVPRPRVPRPRVPRPGTLPVTTPHADPDVRSEALTPLACHHVHIWCAWGWWGARRRLTSPTRTTCVRQLTGPFRATWEYARFLRCRDHSRVIELRSRSRKD